MTAKEKEDMIRRCAVSGQIRWSTHATRELVADQLTEREVIAALTMAEVIEDYPQGTRHYQIAWFWDGWPTIFPSMP